MYKHLKEIESLLKECFDELVNFMYDNLKYFGKDVGEDGKIFLSRATGINKDGNKNDERCDMDADFTMKEYYYKYKDSNIVYVYNGDVFFVNEFGKAIPMKYLGYDKVKDTLRFQHESRVYNIELSTDERIFTPIARNCKKNI